VDTSSRLYTADDFQRHERPFATELSDVPIDVARKLLRELFDAAAGLGYDAVGPRY